MCKIHGKYISIHEIVNENSLVKNDLISMTNEYNDFINHNSNFFSKFDSHILYLNKFLELNNPDILFLNDSLMFKEISFSDDYEKSIHFSIFQNKIVESLLTSLNIFSKTSLLKNLNGTSILAEFELHFSKMPSFTDFSKKIINIKMTSLNSDVIEILHDFMHEIGHIIEFSNLVVNHMCIEYKNKNINLLPKYSLIELEFNEQKLTEVFSVGLGQLASSPFLFQNEHNDYFNFIVNFLIKKY